MGFDGTGNSSSESRTKLATDRGDITESCSMGCSLFPDMFSRSALFNDKFVNTQL